MRTAKSLKLNFLFYSNRFDYLAIFVFTAICYFIGNQAAEFPGKKKLLQAVTKLKISCKEVIGKLYNPNLSAGGLS